MPKLLVVNTDAAGNEYPWLVDAVVPTSNGDMELWRGGELIITLSPDDYAGGFIEVAWDSELDFEGSLEDYIDQIDDDDLEIIHRTVH